MRQRAALLSTMMLALVSSSVLAVPLPTQGSFPGPQPIVTDENTTPSAVIIVPGPGFVGRAESLQATDLPPDESDPLEDGLFGGTPALAHDPLPVRSAHTSHLPLVPSTALPLVLHHFPLRGIEAGFSGSQIPQSKSGGVD